VAFASRAAFTRVRFASILAFVPGVADRGARDGVACWYKKAVSIAEALSSCLRLFIGEVGVRVRRLRLGVRKMSSSSSSGIGMAFCLLLSERKGFWPEARTPSGRKF